MAARGKSGRGSAFWKQQMKTAEKRLEAFEAEAQKVLKDLVARGRRSRREIEQLLRRAGGADLSGQAEEIRARIEKGSLEAVRRLEQLQERALAALGVAGRAQVEELSARVQRLARKINKMASPGGEGGPPDHRRAG